jgi:NAD-dependent dihydropyrimidine dehydrogenase PreA subunit
MEKTNAKVDPQKCSGCGCCQLLCSFVFTGAFNLEKANIVIDWPKSISFTDDCVEGCSICLRYCPLGAISLLS